MTALAATVLADARFPGGGHAHSGGVEEAVARGLLRDEDGLRSFLLGRLRTAGLVAAAFAAAAAAAAAVAGSAGPGEVLAELDAELDARTPSPAQRAASRAQGRAALRAARLAWPSAALDALVAVHPRPHHPLLAGIVVGDTSAAAQCVAYLAVSGPASAAVRLLGLDPLAVNALLVALPVEAVAADAVRAAAGPPADLPAAGSPALDLMAEDHVRHHREQVRLFVS
jgi:urease accessory protein